MHAVVCRTAGTGWSRTGARRRPYCARQWRRRRAAGRGGEQHVQCARGRTGPTGPVCTARSRGGSPKRTRSRRFCSLPKTVPEVWAASPPRCGATRRPHRRWACCAIDTEAPHFPVARARRLLCSRQLPQQRHRRAAPARSRGTRPDAAAAAAPRQRRRRSGGAGLWWAEADEADEAGDGADGRGGDGGEERRGLSCPWPSRKRACTAAAAAVPLTSPRSRRWRARGSRRRAASGSGVNGEGPRRRSRDGAAPLRAGGGTGAARLSGVSARPTTVSARSAVAAEVSERSRRARARWASARRSMAEARVTPLCAYDRRQVERRVAAGARRATALRWRSRSAQSPGVGPAQEPAQGCASCSRAVSDRAARGTTALQ